MNIFLSEIKIAYTHVHTIYANEGQFKTKKKCLKLN